jgi:hypothetical protein
VRKPDLKDRPEGSLGAYCALMPNLRDGKCQGCLLDIIGINRQVTKLVLNRVEANAKGLLSCQEKRLGAFYRVLGNLGVLAVKISIYYR